MSMYISHSNFEEKYEVVIIMRYAMCLSIPESTKKNLIVRKWKKMWINLFLCKTKNFRNDVWNKIGGV